MKLSPAEKELAACYTRVSTTEDGKRVFADLRAKFGGHRLRHGELIRFLAGGPTLARTIPPPKPCNVTATLIDGQASVIAEIDGCIEAGKLSSD